jgi:amidase
VHITQSCQPKDELPPLYGVPVTIKINVDQAGQANSDGVLAFKDGLCMKDGFFFGFDLYVS